MLSALLTMAGTTAVLTATPAQATSAPGSASAAQATIDGVLARNPGARQIDADTVLISDGVVASLAPTCELQRICLWPGQNFTGTPHLEYYKCAFVNIGRVWGNDRIQSIQDHQTSGTRTNFYNWYADTSGWQYVGYAVAYNDYPTVSSGVHSSEALQVC